MWMGSIRMDMAVGIIIGGAFTSIVSSLVEDIINPFLRIFGGMNFDKLHWNIVGDVTLNYGKFLTAVMNFLIMAFVVFILVKALNTAARIAPLSLMQRQWKHLRKICNFHLPQQMKIQASNYTKCE